MFSSLWRLWLKVAIGCGFICSPALHLYAYKCLYLYFLYLCSSLWRQYRVWSAIGGGWGGFIGPLQAQATISDPCRQGHGAGHGRAYLTLLHSAHRIWQATAYVRCPLGTFEPCSAITSLKESAVELCPRKEGWFTACSDECFSSSALDSRPLGRRVGGQRISVRPDFQNSSKL